MKKRSKKLLLLIIGCVLFERAPQVYIWIVNKVYTISEMLDLLNDGKWHSVAYITADANKRQGGRIQRIKECRIVTKNDPGIPSTRTRLSKSRKKSAHHALHATRNLTLRNNLIRKAHIYTIFQIDNTPVI